MLALRQNCKVWIAGYVLQVSFYSPQQYVRYDWLLKCLPGNCCPHLGPNTVILKMPEWCDAWLPVVSSKSGLQCLTYPMSKADPFCPIYPSPKVFFLFTWKIIYILQGMLKIYWKLVHYHFSHLFKSAAGLSNHSLTITNRQHKIIN